MSAARIEAALVALSSLPPAHDPTGALQRAAAEAMREVDEVRRMCRTFKELGVGAFREMSQASFRTMDAIAKEEVPLTVPAPADTP